MRSDASIATEHRSAPDRGRFVPRRRRANPSARPRRTGGLGALAALAAAGLAAIAGLAAGPGAAAAQGALRVTSVRSWTAPSNTRVVFDFSREVTPVMPDSGFSTELVIGIPGESVERGEGVPGTVRVGDGTLDSVVVGTGPGGASFRVCFRDTTRFAVFALRPEEDKPFRIVVDVARRGAAAAEDQKLANLATAKKRDRVRLVVIDPGHGGEDGGARGINGIREKNVTLAVGKALAAELEQIPGVRTLLTRSGDWFIPLRERYRIAEKARADVFISIHCNSSRRRGAGSGAEVFFLSLRGASDQADADLADLENAADLVGGVPQHAEDDLVNILYDVKRNSALQKSQVLAEALLEEISGRSLAARGVKQAGFVVLKSVEFPSVLVETAFINNPREARMLNDPAFQKTMAKQLAVGVKTYFQRAGIGLGAGPSSGGSGATGGSGSGR